MCHFSKLTEISKRHFFRNWLGNEAIFATGDEKKLYFAFDFFGIAGDIPTSTASSVYQNLK
jgi:hypothetical protein